MQSKSIRCPQCDQAMEQGFSHRAAGLSYIRPEKFQHFIFKDEDLAQAGFRKILPAVAEYYRAYLCAQCQFYLVDFSKVLSQKEVKQLISKD